MIVRKTVICLGLSQLISWGISYYLIGGFGELIAATLGWTRGAVYGGFAVALLVMGLTSPVAGRLVDRHGGRKVMVAGSLLNAIGCAGLAVCQTLSIYYAAWLCIGLAMRLTLYDAAFATLARIGGPEARRPMAQITLIGGLASTMFWPLGHFLAEHFGWRSALLVYAAFALLTVPLHLAIPIGRYGDGIVRERPPERSSLAVSKRELIVAGGLYALIMAFSNFLNAGMSSHMIALLSGLGLSASTSVWIASLRGVGQSSARLCEVLFGARIPPLMLNLAASLLLAFSFITSIFSGSFGTAAIAFAFLYGVGNGLLTIARGTLPLTLFDYRTYGAFVGRLIAPSFIFSAAAPVIYAAVIERYGEVGALYFSAILAALTLMAATLLKLQFARKTANI